MDCIFCMIASGAIPSTKVYEDEVCVCFLDINPQAPVHALVIPKAHIGSADEIDETNADTVAHIFSTIPAIAKKLGLDRGYRIVSNVGENGCQSVKHLHFHLLGGEPLSDKMC